MMRKNKDHESSSSPPNSPESLVRRAALEVGFSLVGIAEVSPSAESNEVFDRWLEENRHGDMHYLSGGVDKRHDPGLLLEGAKSVICVAVNYYAQTKEYRNRRGPGQGQGLVAMYAHGRDYHDVLGDMLQDLEGRLVEVFPGLKARATVDTQPISERDFAIRSGIAWLGKNTCVISPEYGSWIFLGELVTNLPLRGGETLQSLCGSCTRCVDSCPTGALDEPFFIDARKCISYLTIEKRGDIPQELHRRIGLNLFGCDECQRVCPFNKIAKESRVFSSDCRNPLIDMKTKDLVDLSDEDFAKLTRGSAIRRCKGRGLRRNARIVMENSCHVNGED